MINKVTSVVSPFDILVIALAPLNCNDAYEKLAMIDDQIVNCLRARESRKLLLLRLFQPVLMSRGSKGDVTARTLDYHRKTSNGVPPR